MEGIAKTDIKKAHKKDSRIIGKWFKENQIKF
jgi:hypothetical protein